MIPKKYESVVFAFLMSFFMTLLMSFVITFINVGLIDGFLHRWFQAFWRAYIVAFPALYRPRARSYEACALATKSLLVRVACVSLIND